MRPHTPKTKTIDELIERSSLGSPGAKAVRAQADPADVAEVLRRVDEMDKKRGNPAFADIAAIMDCTCFHDCGRDGHSGEWHQHDDEPCPVHPDAPMVG